ncbi:DUF4384 domain-containing protein [Cupriavidus sp. 2TAF22]|uniref:DUF4384 domain-containing protein n=1 Tax=unclassified Cupriavidus TaxID=2640874 RepID=UPI003F8F9CA4
MRLQFAALPLLLAACGVTCAQESYSAKSLFFGEDNDVVAVSTSKPANATTAVAAAPASAQKATPIKVASKKPANQSIGASYFIRLKNPDGSTRDVLASRKFQSGDRFQLGVKVNKPSYIFVFNEDANGKITQIYPQPGHNNYINAMGVVFLPGQGAFEFDRKPGTEHLLVYVSQQPVPSNMPDRIRSMQPDVVTTTYAASTGAPAAQCNTPAATPVVDAAPQRFEAANEQALYASKAITFTDDAACGKADAGALYASKAIVFSDDADAGGMQAASYVVKKATTPDASLFLKIRLVHE